MKPLDRILYKINQDKKVVNVFEKHRTALNVSNDFKNIHEIPLDTTITYYDLYDFKGTTYAVGTTSPTPADCYKAVLISGSTYSYTFIYPINAYPVPVGEDPEDILGCSPWEFNTTIAVVKTLYNLPSFPDWALEGAKVVSYLSSGAGITIPNLEIEVTPGVFTGFNTYHRWIKTENGYDLEYQAYYPVPSGYTIDLNTNLYIYNKKVYDEYRPTKI